MNFLNRSNHRTAVLQALFVTFLWSTSWVLIKIGVSDIPPLIFAGLRYGLAFIFLAAAFWGSNGRSKLRQLNRSKWGQLVVLGFIYYGVTQGAQFVSLAYLPAVTANIILGLTPAAVAILGIFILAEQPQPGQWFGIALTMGGLILYFYPVAFSAGSRIGMIAALIGMVANAGSSLWNRAINRTRDIQPLTITTISMGVGAFCLLTGGVVLDGMRQLSFTSWLIVGWLALVNTAFAFTLWNHTLRTLSALESSVINNSMSIQIPLMAVFFLGERLTVQEWIGLGIAVFGVFLVQMSGQKLGVQRSAGR